MNTEIKTLLRQAVLAETIGRMRDLVLMAYDKMAVDMECVVIDTEHGQERLTRTIYQKIKDFLMDEGGGKIPAIKWLRSQRMVADDTGFYTICTLGLKDAKDIIDSIAKIENIDQQY